jgi:hypothetical protein
MYLFICFSQIELQPVLGPCHVMPDRVLIWKGCNILNSVIILLP